jgi:hypothetical protein
MRYLIIILALLGMMALNNPIHAQIILTKQYAIQHNFPFAKDLPPDTLYCYIDTTAVPKNHPLVKILTEPDGKRYGIYCQCVPYYDKNIYLFNPVNRRATIDNKKFKALRLTPLSNFISFMQEPGTGDFNKNYKIYIIEPLNGKYLVNQVFNASGDITIID